MGRKNLQIKSLFNWKSREFLTKKNNKIIRNKEELVKNLLNNLGPLLISKIEYHHISNLNLKIIVYGTKKSIDLISNKNLSSYSTSSSIIIKEYLEKLFNKKVELVFITVPYSYLYADILAQYISIILKNSSTQRMNLITYIFDKIKKVIINNKKDNILHSYKDLNNICGIRIEIKGISGKMAMSKKLIRSIGTHQFNSHNSIIEYGFTKLLNKKGIIGIKVWISYSPLVK